LSYSSQELYWECPALLASESYPAGIPKDHDRNFERRYFTELKMKMSGSHAPSDRARVHMLWQHAVELYSRRELSMETDKLVALAGAANQVSKALDDTFLAGLWVKRLWRDLLWWVERKPSSSAPSAARPKEFKAPSWSWASVKGPISYKFPEGSSYLRYYPCVQVLGYGEKVHTVSNRVPGFVAVCGAILPAIVPAYPSLIAGAQGKPGRTADLLQPSWPTSESLYYQPVWKPDTEDLISEPIQCLIVASSHQYVIGLGLLPTGRKPNECRRVGLTYWSGHYHSFPNEIEFQILTIV
jgi:hypothetical protein